jgi:uncharacterized protein YabN with tetrapyrrole methylase and pyrophosphatase domain
MSSPKGPETLPFDIAVVGLGIVAVHQVTREAEEIMRRCKQVFLVGSGYGEETYVRGICPRVTDLSPLYEVGKSRLPTYRRMAAEVVAAAVDDPPVCFATYGHPWVYCYPTTLIHRAARILDLRFEAFAGISSLDTLLVDLSYDFSADGLQMYDATDLLLRRRPLQNDVGCVLWQTTTFADPNYRRGPLETGDFMELQNYLLEFYPPGHEVLIVHSRTHPALRSMIETYPLDNLAVGLATGPQGTLFIPAIEQRPVADEAFFDQLTQRTSPG